MDEEEKADEEGGGGENEAENCQKFQGESEDDEAVGTDAVENFRCVEKGDGVDNGSDNVEG